MLGKIEMTGEGTALVQFISFMSHLNEVYSDFMRKLSFSQFGNTEKLLGFRVVVFNLIRVEIFPFFETFYYFLSLSFFLNVLEISIQTQQMCCHTHLPAEAAQVQTVMTLEYQGYLVRIVTFIDIVTFLYGTD